MALIVSWLLTRRWYASPPCVWPTLLRVLNWIAPVPAWRGFCCTCCAVRPSGSWESGWSSVVASTVSVESASGAYVSFRLPRLRSAALWSR
jgi:hypothetical protein